MDKKIIFFDIDGTLLNGKGVVPESAKTALDELKKEGHLRFVCTGRTKCMVTGVITELGFDGFVFGGGTQIDYNGESIYEYALDTELVSRSAEILKKYGFTYLYEGKDNIFFEKEAEQEERAYFSTFVKSFGKIARCIRDYSEVKASKITLVPPAGLTEESLEAFKKELGNEFNIIVHEPVKNEILTDGLIELVPLGISKGTGIEKTMELLGIEKEATVGVGDSNNDLEMLQTVGTAVCMGNGSAPAKALADFITTHIDEDGIYHAMKTLGYIHN